MIFGVLAYLMWGLFPAFFPLLLPAGPLEILSHRIIWTAVIMAIVLSFRRGWAELKHATRATWMRVFFAAIAIALNWLIYVVAVNGGHVTEAALGYFINPLLSVVLGIVVFKERLRRMQVLAVVIALAAVLFLTFLGGQPPLMALGLAASFGAYGAFKKEVQLSAVGSLMAETLLLLPAACGYILWLEFSGKGTFLSEGPSHSLALLSSGVITALPLLLFALAAKAIPLSTVGMLQYLTPTMQMVWAVCVVHEHVESMRWIGFIIMWIAVIIYLADLIAQRRTRSRARG